MRTKMFSSFLPIAGQNKGVWSSGMIRASGAWGRGFDTLLKNLPKFPQLPF